MGWDIGHPNHSISLPCAGGFTMKAIIILIIGCLSICSNGFAQTIEDRVKALEETLKKQQETIKEQQSLIEELKAEIKRVRPPEEQTVAQPKRTVPAAGEEPQKISTPEKIKEVAVPTEGEEKKDILSYQVGGATMRLIDISFDGLFAVGTSTERDPQLQLLEGGGHDPRKRGFTVQNVELSLSGAVDPYLNAESHIVYFLDPLTGESKVELEEAFFTTQKLPYQLQVKGGQFFTEFGRINPQHPHQWDWQDQPVINTRLFGPDGIRGPGFRMSWLTPLPWFSELYFGVQNANGETMTSFLSEAGAFAERPIGGRPFVERDVKTLKDMAYFGRWGNSWDLSDEISAVLGFSGLYGPNATGPHGETWIYGTDLKLKWRPANNFRGWPFVLLQSEIMGRSYRADSFFHPGPDGMTGTADDIRLPSKALLDWGFYTQLLWGFRHPWAAGFRYEYATGSGDDVNVDFATGAVADVPRNSDPFRGDRHRISPLLVWQPTEFSRFRLQYNYDRLNGFDHSNAHSAWFGVEFMFGVHGAHKY
jgi:hypothetical protein